MISEHETNYPIRGGVYTYEDKVYRCFWHAQFSCSICEKPHHFSWLYWCPTKKELICGSCNSPTMEPVHFWNKTYSYKFFCSECHEYHFDLFYSEFLGIHPLQLGIDLTQSSPLSDFRKINVWKPGQYQEGQPISIEKALNIPNQVFAIRKKRGGVNFHSDLVSEDELKQNEILQQWEKASVKWIKYHEEKSPDDQGDINRQLIIDPALWKLIGDPSGLKILDAGCGNGYLTRELARRGAEVIGVDFSAGFISYCTKKEQEDPLGCQFIHSTLDEMVSIDSHYFDLVVSNIVFVDVLDYKGSFKEISRVLKSTGRFLWSNTHPIFGRTSNEFFRLPFDTPRNEERKYVMIDRYFDSGGRSLSWGNFQPLWQFDRTLSEYSKALKEAGFVIREIIEPKPEKELIRNSPKYLAFDTDRIPFFIIFDCILFE
jgi:ubiquinone/menaquinone biosynthesis C-methylase UbiE